MIKTLLLFMLLSVKLAFGQVSDDFSDGNITSNPVWSGNTSQFYVNAAKQLQTSSSTIAQTVSLVTANVLVLNAKWEFFIQMNFDPSTSNQARIYLISDNQDLKGSLNGYFIQIGESGNTDSYGLYKQSGLTITKIIDGSAKTRTDANVLLARVKATRDNAGKWELLTDVTGGTNFTSEGMATDLTHVYTDWFGVRCEYTATRSNGFIFDDFSVTELKADVTPPNLISAKALDEFTVEALFSERLESSSALLNSNYSVAKIGNPNSITAAANTYKLTFASALPTGDNKLTVTNVKDVKGNVIGANNTASFFFVKPYNIKKGDVLLSEILSNPRTGGVDFVEIYNNTNQIIDLKDLQLANADASGNPASIKNISTSSVYVLPKTYWVLTTNPTIIEQHYEVKFPNQFVQVSSFPSFNNDKGTVILLKGKEELERFAYNESMHIKLLRDGDGVSLERVSFLADVSTANNFKSAAQSVGFATPTYRNSQEEDLNTIKNKVSLTSKTFSPDEDGFEDLLQINYEFVNNGNLATINVYSDKGVLVRKLQRNTSIATAGSFVWDGLNDAGQRCKVGIYLIKFDTFTLTGKMESFKHTCVLATKLN